TQRLSDQASLAAKLVRPEERNNGFLPLLGNDSDLDLSFWDVEHRVRRITLPEDRFVLSIFGDGSAPIHGGEKYHRVKGDFFRLFCHDRSRLAAPHGQNRLTYFGPNANPILRHWSDRRMITGLCEAGCASALMPSCNRPLQLTAVC